MTSRSSKFPNLKICIIGRQNVGKSTLINAILNKNLAETGSLPGLTVKSLQGSLIFRNFTFDIFDTAGIKARSKTKKRLEKIGNFDSLKLIKSSQIVILVLNSEDGVRKQDLRIANYFKQKGKFGIIVLNKIDLIKNSRNFIKEFKKIFYSRYPNFQNINILPVSALKKINIGKILSLILEQYLLSTKKISTNKLNNWLKMLNKSEFWIRLKKKGLNLKFIIQKSSNPPIFIFFVRNKKFLNDSSKKYLVRSLLKEFSIPGASIRLEFRESD